jgi:hypothetical protein
MERTMQNSDWLIRWIARGLIVLMASSCGDLCAAQAQQGPTQAAAQGNSSAQTNPPESADARGASSAKVSSSLASYPDAPEPQNSQPQNSQPQNSQQASPQSSSGQSDNSQSSGDGRPLGTAAAPYTKPSGVAGSRPAGAAIAPAKQRRVRAILISVGVIAAAGIAVGTVAGLSHASPSRPN